MWLNKYKVLGIVLVDWHIKTIVKPIIFRALGRVKRGTEKKINQIPGSLFERDLKQLCCSSTL